MSFGNCIFTYRYLSHVMYNICQKTISLSPILTLQTQSEQNCWFQFLRRTNFFSCVEDVCYTSGTAGAATDFIASQMLTLLN